MKIYKIDNFDTRLKEVNAVVIGEASSPVSVPQ